MDDSLATQQQKTIIISLIRLLHEDDNNRRFRGGQEFATVSVPGEQVHRELYHDYRHELYLEGIGYTGCEDQATDLGHRGPGKI